MLDGWYGGNGMGGGWWILMTVFWVALIALIFWAGLRLFARPNQSDRSDAARERPEEILHRPWQAERSTSTPTTRCATSFAPSAEREMSLITTKRTTTVVLVAARAALVASVVWGLLRLVTGVGACRAPARA